MDKNLLNDFINSLVNKDVASLIELFDRDAHYDDFCRSGMFNTETHLIGREAIHMHFANRFIFGTYIVTAGQIRGENSAEIEFRSGQNASKAAVQLKESTATDKIKALVLMPA